MSARTREGATYDDVLRAPENMVAELIGGVLYLSPRPGPPHARFSSAAGMDIGGAYDRGRNGPGGWWILDEPELHFIDDVLVPDLAGWRRERLPELPTTAAFFLPPDWVCEVLSPSTRRLDRTKKLPVYAAHDVAWMWLVDPVERTLEVMQLEQKRWVIIANHGGNEKVRAEPFPEVELDLPSIWGAIPEDDDSPAAP